MKREKTKKMNHNIGKEIEQCLKVMEFLEESTDDYLFLYDFKTGKIIICRGKKRFIKLRK